MIRPTARLRFEIDKEELNDALTADIKNCFLNVAPVKVVERPAVKDGKAAADILGLVVVLNYPYWDGSVDGADANWEEILVPWLERKLYKLNATVQGYNRSRKGKGQPVAFGQLEIVLGQTVVAVRLPRDCSFPEEIPSIVSLVRECANEGLFPKEGFLRVEAPWWDPDFDRPEEPASEEAGEDGVPDGGAAEEAAAPGEEAAPDGEEAAGVEPEEPEEPAIDYAVWGVRSEDGTVRLFDSERKEWIDE